MENRLSHWMKIKQLIAYVRRAAKRFLGLNRTVYVEQRVQEYCKYWENAAKFLSAKFTFMTDDIWEIEMNGHRTRINNYIVPINDPLVFRISSDKALCYKLAQDKNIPVPKHFVFRLDELNKAKDFIAKNPDIYVVKPVNDTSSGIGITTHVQSLKELERAAILASLFSKNILVEKMIPAESCRLLFLDGKFINAVRRRGVRVIGDGHSSIRELLELQCKNKTQFDFNTIITLKAQNLSLDSVIPINQERLVRFLPAGESSNHELRTIYDEQITSIVGQSLISELHGIVKAVESKFAGVDILTANPSVSLKDSGGVFLEINPAPGIHHHYIGEKKSGENDVTVKVLKYLLHVN
jgi:D-alanine-D-alanine ligase-like ATP-grasp enzyme